MSPAQPPRPEKIWSAALAVGWTSMLLLGLLLPGDSMAGLETELGLWPWIFEIPNLDKIVHGLLFAGETYLLCLWWRAIPRVQPLAAAALASALLACLTELAQLAIACRSADWADLAANHTGILLASLLILFFSQHRKKGLHP